MTVSTPQLFCLPPSLSVVGRNGYHALAFVQEVRPPRYSFQHRVTHQGANSWGSVAFWKKVQAVIAVFFSRFLPIMKLLRMADLEVPCTAFVYQRMAELQEQLDTSELASRPSEDKERKAAIQAAVQQRWSFLHNDVNYAAYALNPQFLHQDLELCPKEVQTGVDNVLRKLSRDEEQYGQLMAEYAEFRENKPDDLDSVHAMLPHKWWFALGRSWLTLKLVAMKITAQCPTSSESERNWSAYDFIHCKKRNSLTPACAKKLVYIFHNLSSLKKLEAVEAAMIQTRARGSRNNGGTDVQ